MSSPPKILKGEWTNLLSVAFKAGRSDFSQGAKGQGFLLVAVPWFLLGFKRVPQVLMSKNMLASLLQENPTTVIGLWTFVFFTTGQRVQMQTLCESPPYGEPNLPGEGIKRLYWSNW